MRLVIDTQSVCPECLKRIPAQKVQDGDLVYLVKECPEHGHFQVLIWQGEPGFTSWANPKIPSSPRVSLTGVKQGCPFDCGLCPEHRQQTCCVLLEVTGRCNLHCPVCFADTKPGSADEPDLTIIANWYRQLQESGGPYNIQLSGGEPTLRDDLPEIIRIGRKQGFEFFQLNTNGLRLGEEPNYVKRLKAAGLNCVFLQFDGTTDSIYRTLRGASLLKKKAMAIEQCSRYGIGVVLVPTLVAGVNMSNIGEIIRFAVERVPVVRGVHFQPISYFGRYPSEFANTRVTIPEIIREIENQTAGRLKIENFLPAGAENAYCSFHGNFVVMSDGELKALSMSRGNACCGNPPAAADRSRKSRQLVAKQWSEAKCCGSGEHFSTKLKPGAVDGTNTESLDLFLDRVNTYSLAISGMAFQDAWNLDLERLKDCFIQVLSPEGKLIPFCAYNLTSKNGISLYRK